MIKAERARQSVSQMLQQIEAKIGDQSMSISAIGYTELLHGVHREVDSGRRQRREAFFADLLLVATVEPYTPEIAALAGRILGEQSLLGNNIPFVDLMIGATALFHGYSVLTSNVGHFRMIPNLTVISF